MIVCQIPAQSLSCSRELPPAPLSQPCSRHLRPSSKNRAHTACRVHRRNLGLPTLSSRYSYEWCYGCRYKKNEPTHRGVPRRVRPVVTKRFGAKKIRSRPPGISFDSNSRLCAERKKEYGTPQAARPSGIFLSSLAVATQMVVDENPRAALWAGHAPAAAERERWRRGWGCADASPAADHRVR